MLKTAFLIAATAPVFHKAAGAILNAVLETASGHGCCCKFSVAKYMHKYRVLDRSYTPLAEMLPAMHIDRNLLRPVLAYSDTSGDESISNVPAGTELWALNDDPETEQWIKFAYIKDGVFGAAWSKMEGQFEKVGTETIEKSSCVPKGEEVCEPTSLVLKSKFQRLEQEAGLELSETQANTICEKLSGLRFVGTAGRDERLQQLEGNLKFQLDQVKVMSMDKPKELRHYIRKLNKRISEISPKFCMMTCPFAHVKMAYYFRKLTHVVKDLAKTHSGAEGGTRSYDEALSVIMESSEHRELALEVQTVQKAIAYMDVKVMDQSSILQTATQAQTLVHDHSYKAFCGIRTLREMMRADGDNYEWQSEQWWQSQWNGCSKFDGDGWIGSSADLENDLSSEFASTSEEVRNLRNIVTMKRGVSFGFFGSGLSLLQAHNISVLEVEAQNERQKDKMAQGAGDETCGICLIVIMILVSTGTISASAGAGLSFLSL